MATLKENIIPCAGAIRRLRRVQAVDLHDGMGRDLSVRLKNRKSWARRITQSKVSAAPPVG